MATNQYIASFDVFLQRIRLKSFIGTVIGLSLSLACFSHSFMLFSHRLVSNSFCFTFLLHVVLVNITG